MIVHHNNVDTTRYGSMLVLDAFPYSIGEYNSVRLSFFFFSWLFRFLLEVLKTMSYDFLSFEVRINEILIELAYLQTYDLSTIFQLFIYLCVFDISALKVSYSYIWVKERERSSDAFTRDIIF